MFEILIIAVCIMLNAFLAGSETAFISVNKTILREMVKNGKKEAKTLLFLRENPEKTLSVIQIGITFVGAFAAAIGGAGADEFLSPLFEKVFGIGARTAELIAVIFVVILITYVSVVIGELVPKVLGLRRPMFFALKAAPWLQGLSRIAYPIVIVLEKSTKAIIQLFPKKHVAEESQESSIKSDITNQQYVLNIAKLERTVAKDILVKWNEVTFIEFTQSIDEVEKVVISSGHTRLPVVKEGSVFGILNTKEFMALQKTGEKEWTTIIRPPIAIQENTGVLAALRLMQEKRMHMIVVYSKQLLTGIITMEGIIEEIVGDIYDENDDGAIQRILSRRLR